MPIKKTDFYVNKYTDTDLRTLLEAVQDEIARREDARKRRRAEWIYRYAQEAYHYGNFEVLCGNTVVVAVCQNGHIVMGKSTPIKGDKFDLDTGVAVAYAKAVGVCVPDFI